MDAVEADITGELEKKLVSLLTTNHTYFMREFEHFDYMRDTVLPYLRIRERDRRDLHIWCGAASSGEEPYMIAMLLMDFFGLAHGEWDTKILATDVSTKVLRQAELGIYTKEQIEVLPETWKRRYVKPQPDGEHVRITEEIRNEVLFRKFNLMDPFPFRRRMHVIFLRNVMIYFDVATKQQLLRKVYDIMEPGGYLFIGRTETIDRSVVPLQMIQPSIFRKLEGN
jgi:chemotaxis protein methyltransferase CheR